MKARQRRRERPLRPARRPMRADAQRNRDRLVEAARAVFAARGSEASMEEIAKRPTSASARSTGTSRGGSTWSRRSTARTSRHGRAGGHGRTSAGPGTRSSCGWMASSVRQAKRTFLTELHEAFEKNPDLAVQSREKIAGRDGLRVLERAQQAGVARADIDANDLMQLVGGMCMARDASLRTKPTTVDLRPGRDPHLSDR